ncbi:MAG: DUF1631 family protein [Burkholderiales bacterium]|jgi:hypothetical protein
MSKNRKLLNELRVSLANDFAKRLVEAVPLVSSALVEIANQTDDADMKRAILGARDAWELRSLNWEAAVRADYIKCFDEKISGEYEKLSKTTKFSIESLKLVEHEEMREEISLGNVSIRLKDECDYELFALTKRIEGLLDVADLKEAQNPVLPRVFCRSLLAGLAAAEIKVAQRCEILLAGTAVLAELLNETLKEANEVLVSHGFMIEIPVAYGKPINRSVSRTPLTLATGSWQSPGGSGGGGSAINAQMQASLPDLFARLLARLPAPDGRPPGPGGSSGGANSIGGAARPDTPTTGSGGGQITLDPKLIEALERFAASTAAAPTPASATAAARVAPAPDASVDAAAPATRPSVQTQPPSAAEGGFEAGVTPAVGAEQATPLPAVRRGPPDPKYAPTEKLVAVAAAPAPALTNLVRQAAPILAPTMQPVQTVITDVVAGVFDRIFSAPDIPEQIKALIGKLQLQILKASIQDPQIFSNAEHPLRRFVDELADIGVKRPQSLLPGDPFYERIATIVDNLHQNFEVDSKAIERANHQLSSFIQAEEASGQGVIFDSVVEVQQQEEVEMGDSMATFEVDRRFAGKMFLRMIKEFVRVHWQEVLAKDYLVDGEDGEQWKADLATLDELLWSVSPKEVATDRAKFLKLLPTLLSRVNAGLDRIGLSMEARAPYFQVMEAAHKSLLRKAKDGVGQPSDDVEHQPLPLADDPRKKLRKRTTTIARGQWIAMTEESGAVRRCRLSWVSPLKETFVLKNYDTKEAITLTAEEFHLLESQGRIKLIEENSITERSIHGAIAGMLDTLGTSARLGDAPAES